MIPIKISLQILNTNFFFTFVNVVFSIVNSNTLDFINFSNHFIMTQSYFSHIISIWSPNFKKFTKSVNGVNNNSKRLFVQPVLFLILNK